MEIPEEKREFYYWLYENVSPKAANFWLDEKWDKFIEEVRSIEN